MRLPTTIESQRSLTSLLLDHIGRGHSPTPWAPTLGVQWCPWRGKGSILCITGYKLIFVNPISRYFTSKLNLSITLYELVRILSCHTLKNSNTIKTTLEALSPIYLNSISKNKVIEMHQMIIINSAEVTIFEFVLIWGRQ